MHRAGPNCSIQYCIHGAMSAANASEPMGTARVCQSNPMRGMPRPPSLRVILGQATTAAIPVRQAARTSSSRLAYRPTRLSAPMWFRMMGNSGTALAKSATSGIWGRSYWIPGSYTPTASEKRSPFLKPLKNKVFQGSGVTTSALDDIGTSTTLESNKILLANGHKAPLLQRPLTTRYPLLRVRQRGRCTKLLSVVRDHRSLNARNQLLGKSKGVGCRTPLGGHG